MDKFDCYIREMMYKLARIAEKDTNVMEYLYELYGSIAEDDTELCIAGYIQELYM